MCQFKSFVVTKGKKVLMLEDKDSHEDIVDFYNLDDSKKGEISNIVRLEISPKGFLFSCSKRNWEVKIDEEVTPEWFKNRKEKFIDGCFIKLFKQIKEWKKSKKIGGYLNLRYTNITSLPENLSVGGSLYLYGTKITSLPENLSVGGNLNLRNIKITSLPENLSVGGGLYLSGTKITSLPENLSVGGYLNLSGT
ncbi:MAG TPA: hypothetical protein VMZ91_16200, partial [Candidatus Paceibacterota bacterium]|nr:hypothetical protein [Candidatus Paceibacterota bacterium]